MHLASGMAGSSYSNYLFQMLYSCIPSLRLSRSVCFSLLVFSPLYLPFVFPFDFDLCSFWGSLKAAHFSTCCKKGSPLLFQVELSSQRKRDFNASYLILFVLFCFDTRSHCITMAVLELNMCTRLASDSQRSTSICLLRAEIKGVSHHATLDL